MTDNDAELEANTFATLLLVPKELLLREIEKMGGIDLSTDDDIKHLCKIFQVSTATMMYRFQLLGGYSISKHNRK